MAQRLAVVLSTSRYAVDVLTRAPETVQVLVDDDLTPLSREDLARQMNAVARRHHDVEEAVGAIRAVRRRKLFRILVADILNVTGIRRIGQALTDLTGATIDAALTAVSREVEDAPPIGIVAMGRWGGQELSYASDADCLFVVGDGPGVGEKALKIVTSYATCSANTGRTPLWFWMPICARKADPVRWYGAWRAIGNTTESGQARGNPRPCCGLVTVPATGS
ncbi:glutamate-ammonia-ligase adenylyltransferase [Cutibacterium acnes JCM 18918]|nr:glutamate-ammonia-ligase adenylyltransferase [Cutibacterium acnes JCM 18918]